MSVDPKSLARYLRACLLRGTGLLWLAKRRAAKRGIVVMTLHRVLDDSEFYRSSSLPGILLRQQTFQQLLSWAAKTVDVIDLSKGIPPWNQQARSARVAFTFDDGWLDNYAIATPLIEERQTPAVIFVCPGLMGKPLPFWPERVSSLIARLHTLADLSKVFPDLPVLEHPQITAWIIEQLKQMTPEVRQTYLMQLEALSGDTGMDLAEREPCNQTITWSQMQDLHARGIRFGSHTMSHSILTVEPERFVLHELTESKRQIEASLRSSCDLLAYPNGNHDTTTIRAAEKAGYTIAFTTRRGLWTSQTNPLQVPRVNIFEQKLTGPLGRFSRAMAEYALFWKLEPR